MFQRRKKAPEGNVVTAEKPSAASETTSQWNAYALKCPTRVMLDRIADKWAMLALVLLAKNGSTRFNRLRATIEGVSQKVLSQTLKRLERDGLISRRVFPTVPVTVEYTITKLGLSLAHATQELILWSERNIESVLAAQQQYDATPD